MTGYAPDYVSPPGDTILEVLEERGMSVQGLAAATLYSEQEIQRIVSGDAPITHEIAHRLSVALEIPAAFLLGRETLFCASRKSSIGNQHI